MTQLELPPVSFARYFDLLKRRRWQVLPISLLGLIIGASIALLMPRYYVASTDIEFKGDILDLDSSDDPMAAVVDGAEMTIRDTVAKVLEKLGWQEALDPSDSARRAFVESVRERVQVIDRGPHKQRRRTANVTIRYKDTDRGRAKELADALRDTWIADRQRELEERTDTRLRAINTEIDRQTQTKTRAEQEQRNFEKDHRVNPVDWLGPRADGGLSELSRKLLAAEDEIVRLEGQVLELQGRIETAEEAMLRTNRKRTQKLDEMPISKALKDALDKATIRFLYAMLAFQGTTPRHENHLDYQQRMIEAQKELQTLQETAGRGRMVDIDNPDYLRLVEARDAAQSELAGVRSQLETRRTSIVELRARVAELPQIRFDYNRLRERVAAAGDQLKGLYDERGKIEAFKRKIAFERPFTRKTYAWVPPIATEPNVYLVGLAGSAIGLAVAIGLILLFDVLQSTFKTVDDVAHGLPVPVLGAMAYMQTDDQRRRSNARRTRVALVAATFLLLSLTLVTIYYVSPARLPTAVRDVLQVILGDAATGK